MPSPEKISGYQLAEHLLAEGGVEALIRYARNAETDWLELKAGMCLLPEDKRKGETENEHYWNIAKEVIALMNTSGGALVIGVHDKTLIHVPLEDNDPHHIIAKKGIDGYIRDVVRSNVWPSNLMWSYYGKPWELTDKQFPADLISYHHPSYTGPDGHSGEVVVLLIKPVEKIRLARKEQKYFALFKRTRGEVGEAQPIYDPEVIDEYKASREIVSERYANIRDQFDADKTATSESATMVAAIKEYYNGLVEKSRRMRAVFTSLDAEENVFSKDDVDQFYSPEAIETFDDEDRWLDDDDEEEDREDDEEEDEEDSGFDEDGDEGVLDSEDDTEDEEDARSARKGDLLELLKSEQRVIVSGEPGGGKTTCLTYFTLKFAERGDGAPILAVFIPMGQWRRGGSLSLMMERATEMDAGQLAHLMSENRLRLVIDAVNECPDDFRVAAIQNIGMFLAEHPTVPAVISTRHPKELAALHLPVFHVQPMDETHRLRYLERYLQNGEQAQKLLRQLGGMPGGETVAENPMLLRLVVEVYKESPEKRLPNGRAGLYRRSLRAWYKRENEKAEKAGTKLQWNRRQTFELLALLAFKSRQRGYRDVPREEISAIWGADAENQLEVLCQGPIIYCDDEFVRFRHETFQEYLCAEYLVVHQDELPTWTQDDYARWGMPFAYAVELFELDKQQLPESFWLAAWNLNPWLGVALTDRSAGRQLLNPRYHGTRPTVEGKPLDIRSRTPYLRAICGTFDEWKLRHALREDDVPWYKREDVALRYVVFVSRECQTRWNNFEKSHLHCFKELWDKQAIKLAKSWLTLGNPRDIFQYHAPDEWDGWIENASPNTAEALVDAKIALPEDFHAYRGRWNGELRIDVALRLFSKHLLVRSDIEEMLPSFLTDAGVKAVAGLVAIGFGDNALVAEKVQCLISEATPSTARKMIEHGLATKEDFKSRLSDWVKDKSLLEDTDVQAIAGLVAIGCGDNALVAEKVQCLISEATPSTARKLIENGLAAKDDFKSRLPEWLKDRSIPSAIVLVRAGWATKTDFENVLHKWVAFATPQMAVDLLETGLMSPSDFTCRLMEWLQHPQYSFVRKYLKTSGELENIRRDEKVIRKWMSAASMDSATLMVEDGLLVKEDFADKIHEWLVASISSPSRKMLKLHLICSQESTDFENELAAMRQACSDVKKGIKVASEFASKKNTWINSANQSTLVRLVKAGVVAREDINDLIKRRIDHSTPEVALNLINQKLASANDFAGRVSAWKQVLEPDVALKLVKKKIICSEDIADVRDRLKAIVEPKTLSCVIKLGCMRLDDAIEYLDIWGEAVPNYVRVQVKGLMEIAKLHIGQVVRGKVMNLVAYGAFVEIAPGIQGLLHKSEFSWKKRVVCPSDILRIGDEITVQILSIDAENQKVALGIRQMQENPWETVRVRYPVGSRVKGKVYKISKLCALIELKEGIDGMIHISDMSWTRKINCPSECLYKGDEVEAIVMSVDPKERRIALSLKLTQQNPWSEAIAKYEVGMVVVGRVASISKDRALVELEPGVDGLIQISEISDNPVENVKDVLKVGNEITARVINVEPATYRIYLSMRAL